MSETDESKRDDSRAARAHDGGNQATSEKQSNDRNDGKDDAKHGENDQNGHKSRSKKPLIILAVVVLLLAIVAFVWWFMTRNQESTDDAYTDGNAVAIAPKVAGYVVNLAVNDNVYVHKGQLLVQIDPREYAAQVHEAQAQLGLAIAQLQSAQVQLDIARVRYPAEYRQAQAQTDSARADLRQAQAAYNREHNVDIRATSQQNIDAADARAASARASVKQAQAQLATAALVSQQIRQALAAVQERRQQVDQARAQLEQAQLNLAWCEVRAPSDGWITRRNVQLGTYLQPGASLFSIVTPQIWVVANYKESQLDQMRPGDKVSIDVDAYPSLKLHGHVDSIQQGSGSRFSAFPAENATGNFVKIVQRVPVKIVIDSGMPADHPLPLGLSVEPTVYLK
ncbi:HlyD family secretion protein [Trinickia diaoshuihuensis]|uniref:HlyD family secretion protein n=1 Tax=Trinickia diaoshuihuensis TaxID=2292265 RepID=UPI000E2206B2|nr:HlyD family secretion protein [Trinickia diaoshuihuensis]